MVLKKLFGFGNSDADGEESYVELDFDEESSDGTVYITVEKIDSQADVDRVKKRLREGFIVLASIKEMKERDLSELRRAVASIKKTCIAINGDLVGVSDEWIVATPSFARVYREEQQEDEE